MPGKKVLLVTALFAAVVLTAGASVAVALSGADDHTGPPSPSPSTSPSAPAKEPDTGPVLHISDAGPVPLPLDPYMVSMEDIKTLDRARDITAAACMRSLGFTQWDDDTIRTASPEDYNEYDFLEYIDPESASVSGYPRPANSSKPPSADRPPAARHAPTPEEQRAYEGSSSTMLANGLKIPPGGCSGEASRKVNGRITELPVDPRSLAVDSRLSAMRDSRVRRALTEWSACMAEKGLKYGDPVILRNDPRWGSRPATSPAGEEEKRTAGVDAMCQREVNLVGVYKTVRAAYEKRLVDENREKLIAAKPVVRQWVDNARRLIANGGT